MSQVKSTKLETINDETLRSYLADRKAPLLVSFYAPWNSGCQLLEPTLSELAHDYAKRLQISRLNVDDNAHAPAIYGVKQLPHFVLFNEGQVVTSFSGAQPKAKISEIIDSHLSL